MFAHPSEGTTSTEESMVWSICHRCHGPRDGPWGGMPKSLGTGGVTVAVQRVAVQRGVSVWVKLLVSQWSTDSFPRSQPIAP